MLLEVAITLFPKAFDFWSFPKRSKCSSSNLHHQAPSPHPTCAFVAIVILPSSSSYTFSTMPPLSSPTYVGHPTLMMLVLPCECYIFHMLIKVLISFSECMEGSFGTASSSSAPCEEQEALPNTFPKQLPRRSSWESHSLERFWRHAEWKEPAPCSVSTHVARVPDLPPSGTNRSL